MFTKNQFVSQDLQDAIKKIMNGDSVEEAKIVHPNQQRIDVHEPEKDEITADDFKKLRGMKKEKPMKEDTEEVEQFDEKVNVFHSTSPGADMKRFPKDSSAPDAKAHRDATATAVKGLRKTGEMNRKSLSYGSTGDMKTSKGGTVTAMRVKEEAEELDELKKSTVGSYIRKKFDKMSGEPASKNPNEIFAKKDAKGIQRAGLRMSGIKATQKESIDFFDDADEVTVLKSLDIEIQESYTFGDYLTAAKDIVGEEAAIDLANFAFNKQDTALFVEQVTRSDIQSKINTHVAAGHKVSEPKYITKDGKLHAEYVVTDKESGIRRKYIQHGTMRKVENMGAKGKKDSE